MFAGLSYRIGGSDQTGGRAVRKRPAFLFSRGHGLFREFTVSRARPNRNKQLRQGLPLLSCRPFWKDERAHQRVGLPFKRKTALKLADARGERGGHNNIKLNPVFRGMAGDTSVFNKRKT
jgi:hypothetical protein